MKEYEFYINDSEELCCVIKDPTTEIWLENDDAKMQLQTLNDYHLKHVQITSRNIVIELTHGTLTLRNYKEILNEEIEDLLQNILPKIRKKISEMQRKKHRGKAIRNKMLVGTGVVVGGIALFSLIGTNREKKENEHIVELVDTKILQEQISNNISDISDVGNLCLDHSNLEQKSVTYLDFTEKRYSITGEYAYNLYHDLVEKCANKWGISPDIIMAMLTQESAGKKVNLMQIQLPSWEGQELKVYNFSTNAYEKYVLTSYPENYEGSGITCITSKDLEDPETNISTSCILLQESLKYMDYHIGAGIQCYNFGNGNMKKVLNETSLATGISVDEILSNQENLDFMEYTYIIDVGDPYYLKNIVQYIEDLDNGIYVNYINDAGEIEHNSVSIIPTSSKIR